MPAGAVCICACSYELFAAGTFCKEPVVSFLKNGAVLIAGLLSAPLPVWTYVGMAEPADPAEVYDPLPEFPFEAPPASVGLEDGFPYWIFGGFVVEIVPLLKGEKPLERVDEAVISEEIVSLCVNSALYRYAPDTMKSSMSTAISVAFRTGCCMLIDAILCAESGARSRARRAYASRNAHDARSRRYIGPRLRGSRRDRSKPGLRRG